MTGAGRAGGLVREPPMRRPVVTYVDPPWAFGPGGEVDPSLALYEREVFGDRVELRIGPVAGRRYVQEGEAFLAAVRGADALVIHRCYVTRELLAAAGGGLKVVGRLGVGFDNLNPELLRELGIVGFNVPDYCIDEVSTHALALLLALERRIIPQHQSLAGGRFDIYAGGTPRRLREHTAGLIGFGRIGRVVATRLRLFYDRVLAHDPYVEADVMAAYGARKAGFEELLEGSDAVLLHCLLTGETEGMMDAAAFSRMPSRRRGPGRLLAGGPAPGRVVRPRGEAAERGGDEPSGLSVAGGRGQPAAAHGRQHPRNPAHRPPAGHGSSHRGGAGRVDAVPLGGAGRGSAYAGRRTVELRKALSASLQDSTREMPLL
jgi:hypothetical protein